MKGKLRLQVKAKWMAHRVPQHKFMLQLCLSGRLPSAGLCKMYICPNEELLVCLPACTGLSHTYALQHRDSSSALLQCHVTHDLPNSVSLVALHVRVGVGSGRDVEPCWQMSPGAGAPISSCPVSPWGKAQNTAFLDDMQAFSANQQNALPSNYMQANVAWYISIFPVWYSTAYCGGRGKAIRRAAAKICMFPSEVSAC